MVRIKIIKSSPSLTYLKGEKEVKKHNKPDKRLMTIEKLLKTTEKQ